MSYENGRYVVTYNGEIPHYLEVRKQLQAKGERFVSGRMPRCSLAAYKIWGGSACRFPWDVCVALEVKKRSPSS